MAGDRRLSAAKAVLNDPGYPKSSPFAQPFLDSMGMVVDFWAEPSYAQLMLAMQKRIHDYVVADKGTAKEALDALVVDWRKVFKEDGKMASKVPTLPPASPRPDQRARRSRDPCRAMPRSPPAPPRPPAAGARGCAACRTARSPGSSSAPTMLLLLAINIFPLIWTIKLSFTNFRANRPNANVLDVGIDNYVSVLTDRTSGWRCRPRRTSCSGPSSCRR